MVYGKGDAQDAAPVAFCVHCGEEIYPEDRVYMPAEYAGMVHEECAKDWLYDTYVSMLGVWCTVGRRAE